MAMIPIGNFGNDIAAPRPSVHQVDNTQATQALGQAADSLYQKGLQIAAQQRQESEALGRARAANSLLDREMQLRTLQADITGRLQSGDLKYDQAQPAFDAAKSLLDPPADIGTLDPVTKENLTRGLKRIDMQIGAGIQTAAESAKKVEFKGQTDTALDTLGKLSGMPGADVSQINAQADSLDALGHVAYGKDWAKKKQDFRDANWANNAVQRMASVRQDMAGLQQLEHDLTASDGFYVDKLDVAKRNAILQQTTNYRIQLENKLGQQDAKREVKASRAINEIDQQIASGIPATADMWAGWMAATEGTSHAEDFKQRQQDEQTVQDVLRKPIDQQLAFVQQKTADLMNNGGSVRDKANLDRLASAVKANVTQLQEAPLLFNQSRTGDQVQPLDFSKLLTDQGVTDLNAELRDRAATIGAMQKQYGAQVKMRPLLPQDVTTLTTFMDKATYTQRADVLAKLRTAFGDDQSYMAAMQQIAPDSPVRAMAGMIAAKQAQITLSHNLIASDVVSNSGDVSKTMLMGEDLLNKSHDQKQTDGVSKTFPMPKQTDFSQSFASAAGTVFASRPGAYDVAMQAVKAYYVGRAAIDGDVSGVVDSKRMKQAVSAVLGDVVDFQGNGDVLAPWGMSGSDFKGKAQTALVGELQRRGIYDQLKPNIGALGLRNMGDSTYFVVQGRNYLYDNQGKPVMLDLSGRPSAQAISGKVKQ